MKFANKSLIRTAAAVMTLLALNAQDAWAQFSSKVETFTAIAGTGSQQITTTGFQPKAVLFWITDRTSVGNGTFARFGRGWTDGTLMGAAATAWDDGSASGSNNSRTRLVNTACITLINETGTVLAEATIASFNTDGFTINWGMAGGSRLVIWRWVGRISRMLMRVASTFPPVPRAPITPRPRLASWRMRCFSWATTTDPIV